MVPTSHGPIGCVLRSIDKVPPPSPHPPSQDAEPAPRGLGPFSSRQLTAIAISAVVALGLPVGATAAANVMKVSITSGNGQQRAQVTDGRLQVQTAWPEILTTQVAPPSTFVATTQTSITSISCRPVVLAPSSRGLVITSVRVNVFANPSPGAGNGVYFYLGDPQCRSEKIATVNPATLGVQQLSFAPGLPVAKGDGLYAQAGGAVDADVFVSGYTVSGGSVPDTVSSPERTLPSNDPRQN